MESEKECGLVTMLAKGREGKGSEIDKAGGSGREGVSNEGKGGRSSE
jgi:hypothetical protein